MKDISSHIRDLKRPTLLVSAARHGIATYSRTTHLARYLEISPLPGPGVALMQLFEIEGDLDQARRTKRGDYTPSAHVDVLVAIMAEIQLWSASRQPKLVFS